MQGIASPVIGYAGNISALRIDPAIIQHIAEKLPNCNIVLVGQADKEFEGLRRFSNIHFLGNKPPDTVASYFHHFDICINPQVLNEITVGNYPRKVDEYLATGKPVVATETVAMKMFEQFVYLCKDKEAYATTIKYIVDHPEETNSASIQQQRKDFALSHTWENSIGLMGDAFYTTIKQQPHER